LDVSRGDCAYKQLPRVVINGVTLIQLSGRVASFSTAGVMFGGQTPPVDAQPTELSVIGHANFVNCTFRWSRFEFAVTGAAKEAVLVWTLSNVVLDYVTSVSFECTDMHTNAANRRDCNLTALNVNTNDVHNVRMSARSLVVDNWTQVTGDWQMESEVLELRRSSFSGNFLQKCSFPDCKMHEDDLWGFPVRPAKYITSTSFTVTDTVFSFYTVDVAVLMPYPWWHARRPDYSRVSYDLQNVSCQGSSLLPHRTSCPANSELIARYEGLTCRPCRDGMAPRPQSDVDFSPTVCAPTSVRWLMMFDRDFLILLARSLAQHVRKGIAHRTRTSLTRWIVCGVSKVLFTTALLVNVLPAWWRSTTHTLRFVVCSLARQMRQWRLSRHRLFRYLVCSLVHLRLALLGIFERMLIGE
jgi:hypothetical protein